MSVLLQDIGTTRGRQFQPRFIGDLAADLLGRGYSIPLLLALLLVGWLARGQRAELKWAVATAATVVLALWVVLRPMDLYPRFFVWLVPGVVLLAARAVRWRPALAILAAAAVPMALSEALHTTGDAYANRAVAATVDAAATQGLEVCTVGLTNEVLVAYTTRFTSVQRLEQLNACDVTLELVPTTAQLEAELKRRFPDVVRIPTAVTGEVFVRRGAPTWLSTDLARASSG
jgi:hypothetical protein